MEPLVFNFPETKTEVAETKIGKKVFAALLIVVLVAAILTGYFILVKIGKLSGVDLTAMIGRFVAVSINSKKVADIKSEEAVSASEFSLENKEITLLSAGKDYEETAEKGEGITHLARKALKQYLEEKNVNFSLTSEHKVYIEDYLQNKTGDYQLKLGQKVGFSEDLMTEAINSSQKLSSKQLESLRQYSVQVSSF